MGKSRTLYNSRNNYYIFLSFYLYIPDREQKLGKLESIQLLSMFFKYRTTLNRHFPLGNRYIAQCPTLCSPPSLPTLYFVLFCSVFVPLFFTIIQLHRVTFLCYISSTISGIPFSLFLIFFPPSPRIQPNLGFQDIRLDVLYVQIFRIIFCLIDCLPEEIYLFNLKNVVSISSPNRKYMYPLIHVLHPLYDPFVNLFFFAGSECLKVNPFLI